MYIRFYIYFLLRQMTDQHCEKQRVDIFGHKTSVTAIVRQLTLKDVGQPILTKDYVIKI